MQYRKIIKMFRLKTSLKKYYVILGQVILKNTIIHAIYSKSTVYFK